MIYKMSEKIKILLVILFPLILSLIFVKVNVMNDSEFKARVDKNIDPVIEEIEKKYSIQCIGGSITDDLPRSRKKLSEISINFVSYHPSSIQEAREILVQTMQNITNRINSDKKLKFYLNTSPFPPEKIKIALYFRKADHNYFPELAYASSYPGINYYSFDPTTKNLESLHYESFADALKIVQAEGKKDDEN